MYQFTLEGSDERLFKIVLFGFIKKQEVQRQKQLEQLWGIGQLSSLQSLL
tara:strand:+ start:614 stop:763 length:150 start_codon:yes stop_codon:yes gene_type:complete